jgi:hypothetical protein
VIFFLIKFEQRKSRVLCIGIETAIDQSVYQISKSKLFNATANIIYVWLKMRRGNFLLAPSPPLKLYNYKVLKQIEFYLKCVPHALTAFILARLFREV